MGDVASPPSPLRSLLVDRRSFDKTDDYGIDQAIIHSIPIEQLNTPESPVFKKGKIRRRLRWRPKQPTETSTTDEMSVHSLSSNKSNKSFASRASHKSIHSFCSTRTTQRGNTKNKRLSLPRPNYPDHFDRVSNIDESSMAQVPTKVDVGVTTTKDSSTPFRASDLQGTTLDSPHKRGFPSFFRRKSRNAPQRSSSYRWSPRSRLANLVPPKASKQTFSETSLPSSHHPSETQPLSDNGKIPGREDDRMEVEQSVDLDFTERRQANSTEAATQAETRESLESPGPLPYRLERHRSLPLIKSRSGKLSKSDPAVAHIENAFVECDSTDSPEEAPVSPKRRDPGLPMYKVVRGNSEPCWVHSMRPQLPFPLAQLTRQVEDFPSRYPPAVSQAKSDDLRKVSTSDSRAMDRSLLPIHEAVSHEVDEIAFLDAEKNLQAMHDMGIEHLQHHEYQEALDVFEEILRGQVARYGEMHSRVGTALHNIGIVRMKQGDYEEAAQVSLEAVAVRKATLPPCHPDIAVSLSQLGVALLECKEYKSAIFYFRKALTIRKKCYGPKHIKVASLLNNIGCTLHELNELPVAKTAFEEALDIQRTKLRKVLDRGLEDPADQILLIVASTLFNIGSIDLCLGHYEEASLRLEEALLIQQSVLGDEHPFSRRTEACLAWVATREPICSLESDDSQEEDNSLGIYHESDIFSSDSAFAVVRPREEPKDMFDRFFQSLCSCTKFANEVEDGLLAEEAPTMTFSSSEEEACLRVNCKINA